MGNGVGKSKGTGPSLNGYPFAEESLTSEFVSDQRVFVLERSAALSKDVSMLLDEGPRTASFGMTVCAVLAIT